MAETRVTVTLEAGSSFRGRDERGLSLLLDTEDGAQTTPMRALAMVLGSCTGMDVIAMLRKMRVEVTAYTLNVGGPRADEHPRVFAAMTVEHVIRGRAIDPAKIARAVTLSATRYCPVSAMLGHAAPITHRWRAIDDASGDIIAEGVASAPEAVA